MFVCVSHRFEKYNAVITVVTPYKYISPQMWSLGPHIKGEMKQAEEKAWVRRKVRDTEVTAITFVL